MQTFYNKSDIELYDFRYISSEFIKFQLFYKCCFNLYDTILQDHGKQEVESC